MKGDDEMATEKYVSLNNLSKFLGNLKETFSSKEDLDIIEALALINKAAIEANTSALETMKTDIELLAAKIRANEENLENFKKKLGKDIPIYEVSALKKRTVSSLKKLVKESDDVYLATDPDREGEAISWHLYDVLGLKDSEYLFCRNNSN